jgi:hypothetical protein
VLNIVDANHDVVAHLEREIQLLNFFARGGVGGFFGIERRDGMTESRAVDFDENDAEAAGDVFHERGFAVTGRRNEEKQAHEIRALGVAGGADLFGEIVADEGEIDLIDELIPDE